MTYTKWKNCRNSSVADMLSGTNPWTFSDRKSEKIDTIRFTLLHFSRKYVIIKHSKIPNTDFYPGGRLMKKRVMVVDDDKITIKMCEFILKKLDLEVVSASSGKRCLEYLRDRTNPPVDCIVLDLEMPMLNGFNTLSSIRQSDRLKDIPVMFLTASANEETVREAIRLGVRSYLRKPFLPKDLASKVLSLLGIEEE